MQLDIDFGVCALDDYDEDNHPQIQTDSPGISGTEGTQPAERLMPQGFYSRSLDPEKGPKGQIGQGAPLLVITNGDRRHVLPLNDPRDYPKLPKLRKGGRMMAGGAGTHRSFLLIDGEDPTEGSAKKAGSVTLSVSYAKAGAKKSLGLSFNVRDEGTEDISFFHGNGQRVTLAENGVTITSANGESYVEVGNDGNVLAGDSKVQGSLAVGSVAAALPVALGPPLVAVLAKLITMVATTPAVAPGEPLIPAAAALAAELAAILAKHMTTT